jgi:hypothetical protein
VAFLTDRARRLAATVKRRHSEPPSGGEAPPLLHVTAGLTLLDELKSLRSGSGEGVCQWPIRGTGKGGGRLCPQLGGGGGA